MIMLRRHYKFILCKLIKLPMHSSLSFNSNKQKGTQKKPDFHKDIITPNIYANENFELLKNNSYPIRHERKVITAKKAKVKSVIQSIVSKKHVQVSKKVPMYSHRLSKPAVQNNERRAVKGFTVVQPDNYLMDIDQKLNEKAIYYDQQSKLAEQKYRETMQKVVGVSNRKQQQEKEEVEFYITSLSPKKVHIPLSIQQLYITNSIPKQLYKGYVEYHEEVEKNRQHRNRKQIMTKTQMTIKPRPQTADPSTRNSNSKNRNKSNNNDTTISNFRSILFRSNSLMNSKLHRFQVGSDVKENLKSSHRLAEQKDKIRQLFQHIQGSCLDNVMGKGKIVSQMNKLGMVWKTEKEFLDSRPSVTVMQISKQTLDIVKSIRKQQRKIEKIDQKFINQSQQKEQSPSRYQQP